MSNKGRPAMYPRDVGSAFEYPITLERKLLAAVSRGDKTDALKWYNELFSHLRTKHKGDLRYMSLWAMKLISRLETQGVNPGSESVINICNKHLIRVDGVEFITSLNPIITSMIKEMVDQVVTFRGVAHSINLKRVIGYINENLSDKMPLRKLADISGLSGSYLSSIFYKEMGETITNYINRLRVERAMVLLETTDMTCTDITEKCSLPDPSWFSKVFKRHVGLTPTEYRKQKRCTLIPKNKKG